MTGFYDGKIRPKLYHDPWKMEELDRICFNCGKRFGEHCGNICITDD